MAKKKATNRKPADSGELMTLQTASIEYAKHRRKLGISHPKIGPSTLRVCCARGKLRAVKLGKTWLVTRREIQRLAKTNLGPGPGGRPRQGMPGAVVPARDQAKRKKKRRSNA